MNAREERSVSDGGPSLRGFYAYKNTFDASTVWVDIPEERQLF